MSKQVLTFKRWCPKLNRLKTIYIKDVINGNELFLIPVSYQSINDLGYLVFWDTRINRYHIYKQIKSIQSLKGLDAEWYWMDIETAKHLGKYVLMFTVCADDLSYRPLGDYLVNQLKRMAFVGSFKRSVHQMIDRLDEPSDAERNYVTKMSAIYKEMYNDADRNEKGLIVSSLGHQGNASFGKDGLRKKPKKVIFVGTKTGKQLGEMVGRKVKRYKNI